MVLFQEHPDMVQHSYNTEIDITGDNSDTTAAAHLVYRSAYNYDKTFNSNSSTSSREYVVSREDFLLLQRIKAQQKLNKENLQPDKNSGKISHSKEIPDELFVWNHPHNDRYTHSDMSVNNKIKDVAPRLPPRKPKELSNIDPYEERFQRYTKSKYTVRHIEEEKKEESNDNVDDERKPVLPKRKTDNLEYLFSNTIQSTQVRKTRGTVSEIVNTHYEKEIDLIDISDDNNDRNFPIKENYKPKSTMNPVVNRASKPIDFLDSLQNEKPIIGKNHKNLIETTPKAPTHKILDYLESLQQNPNTTVTIKKKPTSKPLISSPSHVDYLDSMQENPSTIITKHLLRSVPTANNKKIDDSKFNQKSTNESNSESFIESALKKSESNYSLSSKKKPLLPNKPNTLTNFQINPSPKKATTKDKKEENSHNDHRIKIPQLRKIEKPQIGNSSPKKNQIQEYIDIPELKSVKKDKTPPPHVDKHTKPNLPEALIKHANLKTNDNLPPNRHILKSKTAPAIPSRKISMPEALKRAKELKENRNKKTVNNGVPTEVTTTTTTTSTITSTTTTTTNDILDTNPSLNKPLSIEDKLSRILLLQKRHTINEEHPSSTSMYTSISFNGTPSPPTSTTSPSISSENSTSSLTHPTKRRAKGPRRKLPTKI